MIVLEGRVAAHAGDFQRVPFAAATGDDRRSSSPWRRGAVPALSAAAGRRRAFGALRRVAVGAAVLDAVLSRRPGRRRRRRLSAYRARPRGCWRRASATRPRRCWLRCRTRGREAGLAAALRTIDRAWRAGPARPSGCAAGGARGRAGPDAAAPQLAQSYARQLALDLDGALAAAERAARLAPPEALPQARLAELLPDAGRDAERARAADDAVELGGGAARPISRRAMRDAGRTAWCARPKPRSGGRCGRRARTRWRCSGLGLALIKQGDLDAGRMQIEAAVVHDPAAVLLRSYLGQAYVAERARPAGRQAVRDRQGARPRAIRRPGSTTRIRLQLANQPVAALRDVERSIALNEDRRRSARRCCCNRTWRPAGQPWAGSMRISASSRLGQLEATRSLALDPSSAARAPVPVRSLFRSAAARGCPREPALGFAAARCALLGARAARRPIHRSRRHPADGAAAARLQRVHGTVRRGPGPIHLGNGAIGNSNTHTVEKSSAACTAARR